MGELASINGEIMPLSKAAINIEDRGFQLGDGIYEVMVSYEGRLFQLDAHLRRLERSAEQIRLSSTYSRAEMETMCREIFVRSGFQNAMLYVQLTRGVYPRAHPIPSNCEPLLVMTVKEKPPPLEEGSAMTTEDLRWKLCLVKSTNLLANVLAKTQAIEAGCFEPIFIRDGRVTEGATTNIFLLQGETFSTPLADGLILEGITRSVAMDIIKEMGYPVQERIIKAQELFTADEIFLTGTITEITSIVKVDGRTINRGERGPFTERIAAFYRERVSP